jgi:hypothetical protein
MLRHMGIHNRQRRAAKRKQRRSASNHRERFSGRSEQPHIHDRHLLHQAVARTLWAAAGAHHQGDCSAADSCAKVLLAEFGSVGRELDAAVDIALEQAVGTAWNAGWQPADVHELACRRLAAPLVELLVAAVLAESRRYAAACVDARWQAMLTGLPSPSPSDGGSSVLHEWTDRHGYRRTDALAAVVEVLALLGFLPRLEQLLPLPGTALNAVGPSQVGDMDQKALARVRALLAKAESTDFPEEAEALSAKAQELMTRHALHRALLDHERGAAPEATGRRLWIDSPYPASKTLLVQAVANSNRCRAVWSQALGFVTVIGSEADLSAVEVLATSLLVQANKAMLAAGRHVSRDGTSRTRSFRQSFLVAYATRIGERLKAADAASSAQFDDSARLLPVLAARSQAVSELTSRLFPLLVNHAVAASNAVGWGAGRAAADLAVFDVREALAG